MVNSHQTQGTRDTSVTRHPQSPALVTAEFRLHAHLSKRSYSMKSPVCSHSPLTKRQRRMRRGTERQLSDNSTPDLTPSRTLATPHTETSVVAPTISINDFSTNDRETKSLEELEEMCTAYMVQKVASTTHSATFLDLQTYFSLYHNEPQPEPSNIIYYKVRERRRADISADSARTQSS